MLTPGLQQAKTKPSERAILRFLFLLITGLRRHCRVVEDSMLPTIREGDLVIYRPLKKEKYPSLQGCIVVAKDPLDSKNLIIKRVAKEDHLGIKLIGDNKQNSIDSRHFGHIHHTCIYGIVEQIISK